MVSLTESPRLDILVRTSATYRLSDFLLWQVRKFFRRDSPLFTALQCTEDTQIQIVDRLWPEIGLLDMIPIILDYQRKVMHPGERKLW